MKEREKLGSRLGFILISAGCAIGIGNVWKFPYMAGQGGGGTFVLFYLIFLALLGLPVMTMEFSVGRASQKSPVKAYYALEKPGQKWHIHGYITLIGCYLLMMFYTTVTGWMLNYFYMTATGKFQGLDSDGVAGQFTNMLGQPVTMGFWMIVVVIAGVFVCSRGLQNGLEKVTKVMMISLLVIMVVLAINSFTMDGAKEGLKFYLLPDIQRLKDAGVGNVIVGAMNQSFFTLSLGIAAMEIFGGNFDEIIIGGAPFNAEVEAFLKKIGFPYTIAYGMTECGPIICSSRWETLKLASCGKATTRMEVKIDSSDPEKVAGEIICRGTNLMLGYYKNQEATSQIIDVNGWLHTGDLGTMDAEGYVTVRGRSKNMLLTSSGQNIYPEEIESKLNNMPYVSESLIVLQKEKLVALIYPDFDDAFANGLQQTDVERMMEANRNELNQQLPAYCQISKVKIHFEEFEKTAKKSIKRFMYQEAKG